MNDLIKVEYSESSDKLTLENHYHNTFEIIYIIEGKADFKINNKEYNAQAGNLIFINNFENHDVEIELFPYKRYFILIDPIWFQSTINDPILVSVFKNRTSNFSHSINVESGSQNIIGKLFNSIYNEYNNKFDYWELALKSYLQKLFIHLFRNYREIFPLTSYNSSIELTSKIQKYIEEHCTEEIRLKNVSELFFVDMYYLSHLFKLNTGFTFKEYLILQRISKAKDLLYYTDDSITTVCMNSGFNNVNHFIRIFKKYTNTTPLKYRNTSRQK